MKIFGCGFKRALASLINAREVPALRWALVVPAYFVSGFIAFCLAWLGTGLVSSALADDGESYFSIVMVLVATFAGVGLSALIAPKYKLIVAFLGALLAVYLVPYPYTYETSGDGEAIPSIYMLAGTIMGGLLAMAVVLLETNRPQKIPHLSTS
jgi:hypothetical protein